MNVLFFPCPSYEHCYFTSCYYLTRFTVYLLQLLMLLLNLGEDGKIVGGLLVQKKTSMLFDGNNSNSCCNLENIRYVSFLLGNAVFSLQYLYEHFKNRKSMDLLSNVCLEILAVTSYSCYMLLLFI